MTTPDEKKVFGTNSEKRRKRENCGKENEREWGIKKGKARQQGWPWGQLFEALKTRRAFHKWDFFYGWKCFVTFIYLFCEK